MCDGIFISSEFYRRIERYISWGEFLALERNQVDEFFTQSSLTIKPVVKEKFS